MFAYRIGLPFWEHLARMGVPLKLRVHVLRDTEADVFVATSHDLSGLVCEAATMDELVTEVNAATQELLSFKLDGGKLWTRPPTTDLRLCGV